METMSLGDFSRTCPNCQVLVRNPLEFCSNCGEKMPEKSPRDYNRIILTNEDYRALIEDAKYWKCDYCGTISNTDISQCPICGAGRKEVKEKVKQESKENFEDLDDEELLDEHFGEKKGIGGRILDSFLRLPAKIQYFLIAFVLGLLAIYTPWSSIPYGQWLQLLLTGGALLFGYLIFKTE